MLSYLPPCWLYLINYQVSYVKGAFNVCIQDFLAAFMTQIAWYLRLHRLGYPKSVPQRRLKDISWCFGLTMLTSSSHSKSESWPTAGLSLTYILHKHSLRVKHTPESGALTAGNTTAPHSCVHTSFTHSFFLLSYSAWEM